MRCRLTSAVTAPADAAMCIIASPSPHISPLAAPAVALRAVRPIMMMPTAAGAASVPVTAPGAATAPLIRPAIAPLVAPIITMPSCCWGWGTTVAIMRTAPAATAAESWWRRWERNRWWPARRVTVAVAAAVMASI